LNGFGANDDDMRFLTKFSERELDGILAGKAPDGELEDVATFFRTLRTGLEEAPPAPVEAGHLAAIFDEARHLQPSTPELQTSPSGQRRVRNPFRRLAARATIAAAGLAALAAFGGAAYAGALPSPVQGKVADIAGKVGVSLPGNDERSKPHGGGGGGVQDTGSLTGRTKVDQPAQGTGSQGSGDQGSVNQGSGDQGSADQGSGDQGDGQTDRDQPNGGQGNGDQGSETNGRQGAQTTTTVQGGNGEQGGTQGAGNEPGSAPGGGSGADGGQQGNGAGNGDGNG
jgi:hypothetical protein